MKNKLPAFLVLVCIGIILLLPLNSCNPPQPSKCVITVRDSSGDRLMVGVAVHLYASVSYNGNHVADLKADGITGSDGKVAFTFKNPCVMDVLATVGSCTVSAGNHVYCNGSGIVKCEEGKTAEKTIRIDH
jgi:hypothetical protein